MKFIIGIFFLLGTNIVVGQSQNTTRTSKESWKALNDASELKSIQSYPGERTETKGDEGDKTPETKIDLDKVTVVSKDEGPKRSKEVLIDEPPNNRKRINGGKKYGQAKKEKGILKDEDTNIEPSMEDLNRSDEYNFENVPHETGAPIYYPPMEPIEPIEPVEPIKHLTEPPPAPPQTFTNTEEVLNYFNPKRLANMDVQDPSKSGTEEKNATANKTIDDAPLNATTTTTVRSIDGEGHQRFYVNHDNKATQLQLESQFENNQIEPESSDDWYDSYGPVHNNHSYKDPNHRFTNLVDAAKHGVSTIALGIKDVFRTLADVTGTVVKMTLNMLNTESQIAGAIADTILSS